MRIINGDCLEVLKTLPDESVDSIVTDPPYELGFMGKKWDNTGIAYNVDLWKECLRVLKSGGHLLAFGGTRTYHRMVVAIEDAGFEIRDMIEWVYGSGFPKSLNISKAMEGVIGKQGKGFKSAGDDGRKAEFKQDLSKRSDYGYVWKPTNENTKQWEGWGTALKPSHEPICMARKPLAKKTVAENVLKHGTGGINIDGSRVATDELTPRNNNNTETLLKKGFEGEAKTIEPSPLGRFPANLIHDNSEEVRECFPVNKSSDAIRKNNQSKNTGAENGASCYGKYNDCDTFGYSDSGSASRFFKSIIYTAKADKTERSEYSKVKNNHPTVKPVELMEYLIKMVTPKGGIVLDPFMGSGTTGVASKNLSREFIGIELDSEYYKISESRINNTISQVRLDDLT